MVLVLASEHAAEAAGFPLWVAVLLGTVAGLVGLALYGWTLRRRNR